MRKIIFSFIFLFLIANISATGLVVTGDNIFNINKTIGTDPTIIFTLRNTESYAFYNITFEKEDLIYMPQINVLNPGAEVNVVATIKVNQHVEENFKIKGYYESLVGVSNEIYNINVDFNNGVETCVYKIVKGDTIIWYNDVPDEIKLINSNTQNEITTMVENSTYQLKFENPETLNYHFLRRGYQFTDNCRITAINDNGLVNDPDLNGLVYLNLKVQYNPTTIEVSTLDDSYIMDFYAEQDGIIQIKNTGTDEAKNIILTGDWFVFDENDLNIQPGYSKTVSFSIKPIIATTNDTDKSYNKAIGISGNFDKIYKNFTIFINYADIDSGNYTQGESILDLIVSYCNTHPETTFCKTETKIIYRNSSNEAFNVSFGTQQVNEIFNLMFKIFDDMDSDRININERIGDIGEGINMTASDLQQMRTDLSLLKEEKTNSSSFLYFAIAVILFVLILVGVIFIFLRMRRARLEEELDSY